MKQRSIALYLQDMVTSMDRIALYIQNLDFESFEKNFMVVDAVVRNFEVIGEATRKVPDSIKEQYPEIPWKKMYQLRNIVSHEYFDVDRETIWKIATEYLPQNKKDLEGVLKKMPEGF